MIISCRHNFISIKSGKTASSSVERALAALCGPEDVVALSQQDPSSNRNTGLSLMASFVLWAPIPPRIDANKHKKWRRSFYDHMPAFRLRRVLGKRRWQQFRRMTVVRNPYERALSNFFWNTRHREPADDLQADINRYVMLMPPWMLTNWQMYALGEEVLLDTFLRYETIESDFQAFASSLGMTPPPLPQDKSGHRPKSVHYRDALDAASRRRIEAHAGKELAYFGYAW